MIKSLTGYGKTELTLNKTTQCTIQIKSVNSKIFDLSFKIPYYLKDKETELKQLIQDNCLRGKIECSIDINKESPGTSTTINDSLIKEYIKRLNKITRIKKSKGLELALQMPGATTKATHTFNNDQWKELIKGIQTCIKEFETFRIKEGIALEKDFLTRLDLIASLLTQIKPHESERLEQVKSNLKKSLDGLKLPYDENRFEQELIYYLEKYSFTEEKVRLESHIQFFKNTLNTDSGQGKKLNFILQEMGREINTIGSKANYFKIQKIVVEMKDELEKMKEQILNIL